MEVGNFDRTLNAFKGLKPFRPFTVVLIDGDRFEVDYPNALVARDGMAVYIAAGGAPILFDHEGVNQFIGDLKEQTDTWHQIPPACPLLGTDKAPSIASTPTSGA